MTRRLGHHKMSGMATVLIVDDDPAFRQLAGRLVEQIPGVKVQFADGGDAALKSFEISWPDLILTDLNMPGIGGMEVIDRVHAKHEGLPIIVMTGHGSEEMAVKALLRGAASYIPKSNLAEELEKTVADVLDVAQAEQRKERLHDCITQTNTEFLLENDPDLIMPLVGHLQAHLARMRLCDADQRIQVGIALMEALSNALYHGNLEMNSEIRKSDAAGYYTEARRRRFAHPYRDRRIYLRAVETHRQAVYTIRDEGPGFNVKGVLDPTDSANLDTPSGRGLLLIRTFMDEVHHNNSGNEIVMTVHRRD